MPRSSRPVLALAVGVAVAALGGCRDTTGTGGERRAELLGAVVPATAVANRQFDVVAVFGRGACDYPRPHVERNPSDVRVGLRVTREDPPNGAACPDVLRHDSVRVIVIPPFTLPFTVRLEGAQRDSVLVVRERSETAAAPRG